MTSARDRHRSDAARSPRGRSVPGHHPAVRARARGLRPAGVTFVRRDAARSWRSTTTRSNAPSTTWWPDSRVAITDLIETFHRHADELSDRLDPDCELSAHAPPPSRRHVHQRVRHRGRRPVQPQHGGASRPVRRGGGCVRVVMSVRGIGEGHRSSIGFRTGSVDAEGDVIFDARAAIRHRRADRTRHLLDAAVFRGELRRLRGGGERRRLRLEPARARSSREVELESLAQPARTPVATRPQASRIISLIREHRRAHLRRPSSTSTRRSASGC